MGSVQEEDKMLILPKAQLGNMLTSPTPDLTVTEMHGRTTKTSSSSLLPLYCMFLGYARILGVCGDMDDGSLRASGGHVCVVLLILVV